MFDSISYSFGVNRYIVKGRGDAILVMLPNFLQVNHPGYSRMNTLTWKGSFRPKKLGQEVYITVAQSPCNQMFKPTPLQWDSRHGVVAGSHGRISQLDLYASTVLFKYSGAHAALNQAV